MVIYCDIYPSIIQGRPASDAIVHRVLVNRVASIIAFPLLEGEAKVAWLKAGATKTAKMMRAVTMGALQ